MPALAGRSWVTDLQGCLHHLDCSWRLQFPSNILSAHLSYGVSVLPATPEEIDFWPKEKSTFWLKAVLDVKRRHHAGTRQIDIHHPKPSTPPRRRQLHYSITLNQQHQTSTTKLHRPIRVQEFLNRGVPNLVLLRPQRAGRAGVGPVLRHAACLEERKMGNEREKAFGRYSRRRFETRRGRKSFWRNSRMNEGREES
jgi:hypothetical protein